MKANKIFAFAMMAVALVFAACGGQTNPDGPDIKKTTPDVAATDGAVTVVWNIANIDEMCDVEYVFAGNYNGWDTKPENMVRFEPIADYKGWYKAVIVLADDVDHLEGKPCALQKDGTFESSWGNQWIGTEEHPCEIVGGAAELQVEYEVESKLVCTADADVVFVKSYAFKTNPCVDAVYDDVTFTLTVSVPVTDGGIVYIVGDAFEKSWDQTAYPMTGSGDKWTITLPAIVGKNYKFCVNADWNNDQMVYNEEKQCVVKADNMTVDFITMNPTVYGFMNFGVDSTQLCEEEKPEAQEGVLYIKCAANGWAWDQMIAGENKTFTYDATVKDASNVGANINVAADDAGAVWYDLGDMSAAAHNLAEGDEYVYTFVQTEGADGTLSVAKK